MYSDFTCFFDLFFSIAFYCSVGLSIFSTIIYIVLVIKKKNKERNSECLFVSFLFFLDYWYYYFHYLGQTVTVIAIIWLVVLLICVDVCNVATHMHQKNYFPYSMFLIMCMFLIFIISDNIMISKFLFLPFCVPELYFCVKFLCKDD